jgi:hypothetical protein
MILRPLPPPPRAVDFPRLELAPLSAPATVPAVVSHTPTAAATSPVAAAPVRLLPSPLLHVAAMATGALFALMLVSALVRRSDSGLGAWAFGDDRVVHVVLILAVVSCVGWALLAAVNGRRLSDSSTIGAVVAPVAYAFVAASLVLVQRAPAGASRVATTVLWAIAAVTVHFFVVSTFGKSAGRLGEPLVHTQRVVWLPMAGGVASLGLVDVVSNIDNGLGDAVGIVGACVGAVCAAVWLWSLHVSMHSWEHACRVLWAGSRHPSHGEHHLALATPHPMTLHPGTNR